MRRPRQAGSMGAACRLLGVFAMVVLLGACGRKEAPTEPVRAVRTQRIAAAEAAGWTQWAAELRARREATLGFRVGGKLMARDVELGQKVRAGQVLARLDPNDLALAQQAAQAALQAAGVQWTQAQADFRRFQTLQEQGFISAAELERRKTALDAARAQRDQAQAAYALQGNQARHATLQADAAGVVTAVLADPGTVLAAGTPVLRVAAEGPIDAVFSVPESRVQALRSLVQQPDGLQVRVGVDGPWQGATLRELASAADPATRTFLAKATLAQADVVLGQTAAVRMPAGVAQVGTREVPASAVGEREGHAVVWLLDGTTMTVKPEPVDVVQADGATWRIKAGWTGEQELVTAGLHVLQPGQKVRRYGALAGAAPAASAASAP